MRVLLALVQVARMTPVAQAVMRVAAAALATPQAHEGRRKWGTY